MRGAVEERGEVVRWCVSSLDGEARRATAEVVLLPHAAPHYQEG